MPLAPSVARATDRRAKLTIGAVTVRGVLAALTIFVVAACSASDSSDSSDGGKSAVTVESGDPSATTPVLPEEFTQVELRVTEPTGETCVICVWLADSGDERSRGLMGVTDLGGPVGMAFVYTASTEGRFFMYQTPMPLSIAWFSDTGAFVGSTDMEPCVDEPRDDCLRYSPGTGFALAVEVPQGLLGEYGLVEGSTVEVLFDTEGLTCPEQ